MHETFDLEIQMIKYTGVSQPPGEADLDEVGTESLLPPFGCVPRAIQTQSEFADLAAAELWIFRREFDEEVPVDLTFF